jgi:serine/threonine-protein kinase
LGELIKLRRSDSTPTTPTSIVKDLDPVIESIIDRCIQKDPVRRPASALQVAAALPGGDPIAAALAAGETPSPEMVAAAPKAGALQPAVAISALAGIVAVLLFLVLGSRVNRAERNVPLEKPPEVLAERARDMIANLGYQNSPVDQAHGFFFDQSFPRYLQTQDFKGWEVMRTGQPLTFYYWYKQAPRYLIADGSVVILPWNPPSEVSGMTNITLDPRGRLVRFERVPPQIEESAPPSTNTDWSRLFAAAGLDQTKFTPTQPKWVPLLYADERAAWEGPHVDHPQFSVRIEAAAFRNRAVNFEIIFPWDRPFRQEEQSITGGERVATIMLFAVFLGVAIGAALMGRQNLQLGRGDKRSAFRLAIFIFLVSVTGGLLGAHHVPDLGEELGLITLIVAFALAPAALIWLLYIALEPHVRRRWPRLIISWSRLMAGNFRDPMVGRDLLMGGLLGLIHGACIPLGLLITRWGGFEAPPIITINAFTLGSPRRLLAVFLNSHLVSSVFIGFAFLFFLLLLYIILRKEWLATLALFLIALAIEVSAFAFGGPRLFWVASILVAATLTILISRFGLLATMVAQLFFFLSLAYPLTTDFSAWYAPSTIFALVIALGLSIYGFYISVGGKIGWTRFTEVS